MEIKRILSRIVLGLPVTQAELSYVICLGTDVQADLAKRYWEVKYGNVRK